MHGLNVVYLSELSIDVENIKWSPINSSSMMGNAHDRHKCTACTIHVFDREGQQRLDPLLKLCYQFNFESFAIGRCNTNKTRRWQATLGLKSVLSRQEVIVHLRYVLDDVILGILLLWSMYVYGRNTKKRKNKLKENTERIKASLALSWSLYNGSRKAIEVTNNKATTHNTNHLTQLTKYRTCRLYIRASRPLPNSSWKLLRRPRMVAVFFVDNKHPMSTNIRPIIASKSIVNTDICINPNRASLYVNHRLTSCSQSLITTNPI